MPRKIHANAPKTLENLKGHFEGAYQDVEQREDDAEYRPAAMTVYHLQKMLEIFSKKTTKSSTSRVSQNLVTDTLVVQYYVWVWLQCHPTKIKKKRTRPWRASKDSCRRFKKQLCELHTDSWKLLIETCALGLDARQKHSPSFRDSRSHCKAVRGAKDGISGLPGEWWDCATRCCCFLLNVTDEETRRQDGV